MLAVVFALIILAGVLFAATHPNAGGTASSPTASPTVAAGTTPQPTATPQPKPTAAPTQAPQPTAAPTPQPTTPASGGIPVGGQLYSATAPGPNCDNGGGQWSAYNGVQVNCQSNATQLASTTQKDTLQGIFLTKIPNRAFPANYVVQAQLQPSQNSTGAFGIYFRNQPDSQQGAYAFLLRPDGSWTVNVYDNNTGALTRLATGSLGSPVQDSVQMAVVAKGSQLSFYINGQSVKTLNDQTYSTGTAGVALGMGANVTASNFTLSKVGS